MWTSKTSRPTPDFDINEPYYKNSYWRQFFLFAEAVYFFCLQKYILKFIIINRWLVHLQRLQSNIYNKKFYHGFSLNFHTYKINASLFNLL
jgi:hypothetical protein